MSAFNWQAFFKAYAIRYVEEGANVADGNINIRCPFCGDSDPSEHLGVHLKSGKWGCWRSPKHRGLSPVRLIEALLVCTRPQAMLVAQSFSAVAAVSEFGGLSSDMFDSPDDVADSLRSLVLPDDIRTIDDSYSAQPYRSYLMRRKFHSRDIDRLIDTYDLRFTITRPKWKDRVIWPVYQYGMLVGLTGRTIRTDEPVRYKSLTYRADKAQDDLIAPVNIKHTLLNYESLIHTGGKVLFVVEGPMDAMKLDFYGQEFGCHAVCLFSMDCSVQQEALLHNLRGGFDRMILILDAGEDARALSTTSRLDPLRAEFVTLPEGLADPGAMAPWQVEMLAKSFCKTG